MLLALVVSVFFKQLIHRFLHIPSKTKNSMVALPDDWSRTNMFGSGTQSKGNKIWMSMKMTNIMCYQLWNGLQHYDLEGGWVERERSAQRCHGHAFFHALRSLGGKIVPFGWNAFPAPISHGALHVAFLSHYYVRCVMNHNTRHRDPSRQSFGRRYTPNENDLDVFYVTKNDPGLNGAYSLGDWFTSKPDYSHAAGAYFVVQFSLFGDVRLRDDSPFMRANFPPTTLSMQV
jgi:hypothetical protein